MLKLFTKYLDNQCSPEEVRTLLAHFNDPENEMQLRSLILASLDKEPVSGSSIDGKWEEGATVTYEQIKKKITSDPDNDTKVIPITSSFKGKSVSMTKLWVGVAASVVIVSAVTFTLLQKKGEKKIEAKIEKKFENDIAPGGDKAILTLADGRKVILDNTKNGAIADEGVAHVTKTKDGELVYTITGNKPGEVFYNSVSTPRGGQYRLVLPDGSRVWLNASSSIRFPNVFNGNDRKVEITGEVYFEVTKNKAKPFRVAVVSIGGELKEEVEALGTHFNINSYDDEMEIKATLLEGALKVKKGDKLMSVSPGQQAVLSNTGEMKLLRDIDEEVIMAWKNGKFIFNDDDIKTVMRQLEKWYDIVVEYRGALPKDLMVGVISRDVSISKILTMLEQSGAVNFEVRGRKVIIEKK